MATAVSNRSMELEGNLKSFPLPDVLRFLAMGAMTGILTLAGRERTVELTIKEGQLVGAISPERFLKLGQLLVYGGLLSRKNLEEVLEAQHESGTDRMLGEMLVERCMISREQIEEALRLQVTEELWDLFSWTDGVFKFEHGENPVMDRVMVSLQIEPLLGEGAQRMQQWRGISERMSDLGIVFRVRGDLAAPPEGRMKPNTWRVLSFINGRRSVQLLIYLSGLGKFETLCALDQLLGFGLIEPVTGKELEEEPEGGREPVAEAAKPDRFASPAEEENQTPFPAQEGRGGLKSLFGMRKKPDRPSEDVASRSGSCSKDSKTYLTSVALGCDLIGRLASRVAAETGQGDDSARLLESLWRDFGMRFPRADLVRPRAGALDATLFDRYARMARGVDQSLTGCLEDTMAALAAVGRELVFRAKERAGDRAQALVEEVARPYLDGVQVTWPVDFLPRTWARQWSEMNL